jgi:hypothetical protein
MARILRLTMRMKTAYDTGWTMEAFVRWAFGPRHLAYLAVDVDLARRSAQLLANAPEPAEIRRRLLALTRNIESTADARFLHAEADLARGLVRLLKARRFEQWMCDQLREGFARLELMVRRRLVRLALLEHGSSTLFNVAA